jgi:predicted nuclease of predicted toxin-antitoxin system
MNLVADEGIDAPIVQRLRADGHAVWYVAELSPSVPDEEVLALAVEHTALLITSDKDFGALVFQQRRASSGVILLRLAGLSAGDKAAIVGDTVAGHGARLIGSFTVITPRRVRIRPSP